MLIVLPPSETKAPGGDGPALDLEGLGFPALNPVRSSLIDDLSSLEVPTALEVLKISEKLRPEAEANLELRSAPTMPALHRYTGVLFDALSAPTLPARAWGRLAVGSALFGLVRAGDLIPVTGSPAAPGCRIPGPVRGGADSSPGRRRTSWWTCAPARARTRRVPGAVTVRVEGRQVVSHFKSTTRASWRGCSPCRRTPPNQSLTWPRSPGRRVWGSGRFLDFS